MAIRPRVRSIDDDNGVVFVEWWSGLLNELTDIHPGIGECQRGAHAPEQRPDRNLPLIIIVWRQEPALADRERWVADDRMCRMPETGGSMGSTAGRRQVGCWRSTRGVTPMAWTAAHTETACRTELPGARRTARRAAPDRTIPRPAISPGTRHGSNTP